jgi:hypothetical protein
MIVLKTEKIAKNPIARAVAADKLKKRMLDQRIELFMLDEGQDARAQVIPIADSVFVLAAAYQMMKWEETVEFRKLRSAMTVLTECSERQFRWHMADTVTIDNAITICVDNWRKVPPTVLYEAIQHIMSTMR